MPVTFLNLPQSDAAQARSSAQFAGGAKSGEKAVTDYEDTQYAEEQSANKLAETQRKEKTALENKLLQHQIGENVKVNDSTYTNLHSGLTARIADLQRQAESGDRDPDALAGAVGKTREVLERLDRDRRKNVESNPTGLHSYDPAIYDIAGVPRVAPLTEPAKAAKTGRQMSETYGGFRSKQEYDAANSKGEKITPPAEAARDNFRGALANLPTHAQRVVDATRFYKANKTDPKAVSQFESASGEYRKTRDAVRTNYSAMIDRLTDGGFGADTKQTFDAVAKGLPKGAALNDISNHGAIADRVEALIAPFESAKSKRALTPAETEGYLKLSKLRDVLNTRDNLSKAWADSDVETMPNDATGVSPSGISPMLKAPLTMPVPRSAVDSIYKSRYETPQ